MVHCLKALAYGTSNRSNSIADRIMSQVIVCVPNQGIFNTLGIGNQLGWVAIIGHLFHMKIAVYRFGSIHHILHRIPV